jgi:glycerophosphoryl diester phosphodiesterase
VELGAPGIELDVQLTNDGVPAILHDPWLWSNGTELFLRPFAGGPHSLRRVPIAECKWADIEDVPIVHLDGSRELIPRFEEVLEAVPASLWIDVELKAGWRDDPRLVGLVLGCIKRRSERVLVSSFDHVVLKEVAAAEPELPLLAICHARLVDAAGLCASIPASMICIDRPFLTASDVVRWRDEGLEVSVGGGELVEDLVEVCSWPVSGIFLDDPRLVVAPAATEAG